MPQEQAEILAMKYKSLPFRTMKKKDFDLHVDKLLLTIHVITGWKLPANDALLNILAAQFGKKLLENYGTCNPDEMEYAFRNYGTSVKDWGKEMNLNLIDTVMNAYIGEREEVSRKEEQEGAKSLAISYKPSDEELMNMRRHVVEERYQAFLQGQSSFVMQPVDGIETLANDGYCEADLHKDFLANALKHVKQDLGKERENLLLQNNTAYAESKQQEIDSTTPESQKVLLLAKKMALVYCFMQFQKAGFKQIYKPV